LLVLNLFLIVVGCMMDIFSATVIVVPLITPLAAHYGVNPYHLAIIFMLNLELGYNTPPVGMNLFISCFRFRQPMIRLYKATFSFMVLAIVALGIVTYVPSLSTFALPKSAQALGGAARAPRAGAAVKAGAPAEPATTKAPATKQGMTPMDGVCDPNQPNDPDCKDDDFEVDEGEGKKKKGTGSKVDGGSAADGGGKGTPSGSAGDGGPAARDGEKSKKGGAPASDDDDDKFEVD
jgi:hypothetical protein